MGAGLSGSERIGAWRRGGESPDPCVPAQHFAALCNTLQALCKHHASYVQARSICVQARFRAHVGPLRLRGIACAPAPPKYPFYNIKKGKVFRKRVRAAWGPKTRPRSVGASFLEFYKAPSRSLALYSGVFLSSLALLHFYNGAFWCFWVLLANIDHHLSLSVV